MSFEYFEANSHVLTYKKFRPSPPRTLIERIIEFTREKVPESLNLAVDVGCGSGQSTEVLAPYFTKVLGLDSSSQILIEARKKCQHSNVFYSTSPGEKMNVDDATADVITLCQALHWLDIQKFYLEAERILKPKGVLAVYGYNLPIPVCKGIRDVEKLLEKYYIDILKDYTLPQSRKVYLEKYTTKEFTEVSFVEGGKMIREDNFALETSGCISDVIGYVESWSAYQNYVKQKGEKDGKKLLKNIENELRKGFESAQCSPDNFKIKFEYFLLLGRKE